MERLRAELEVAREQQAATSEILHLISRMGPGSQAEPVLEAIVATAARLCGAEFALAHLVGITRSRRTRLTRGWSNMRLSTRWSPAVALSPGGRLFEGRTIHVEDCLADPEYAFPEFQRIGGFRSILGVPLIRDGVAIGVLGLLKSVVAPFTEAQIGLVTTFADQAVIALQNVRLFEELQECLRYQTATSDVLNVISRSPAQIEPVLDAIVETAGRLCEAYDTLIILREGEWLTAAAHAGPIEVGFDKKPVGRSWVAGRAVADREPVHVPDFLSALDEFPIVSR